MTFKNFINSLPGSPYIMPNFFKIPDANIAEGIGQTDAFEARQDYFTIRVNEMYIQQSRKWFNEMEPMVICLSEYVYDGAFVGNPFIVGSNLLKNKVKGDGKGFHFRDTRVAGTHPYAGGRVILSFGLYENEIDNHLRGSIKFLEGVSSVFNNHVTVFFKSITKATQVIMDGVDELLQSKKTKPLFGLRIEFDPATQQGFTPGYYVLANKLERQLKKEDFFVDEQNKLQYIVDGKRQDFREAEYILLSFIKSDKRNDDSVLPIYKSFEAILDYAKDNKIGDVEKQKIKDMFRVLNFEMAKSPDLTTPDAQRLIQQYFTRIEQLLKNLPVLGPANNSEKQTFWTNMDKQISAL